MLRWAMPWVLLSALPLCLLSPGCSRPTPLDKRDVADLSQMLDNPDPTVQSQGAFGLGEQGAQAASAVPGLIRLLASNDIVVRQQACGALGKIGPGAEQAVPALVETLNDREWIIRQQAAIAIGQIHPRSRPSKAR